MCKVGVKVLVVDYAMGIIITGIIATVDDLLFQ